MDETAHGMERRLVLRLLSHWREMCGERAFPSFEDLDPTVISDIWDSAFVLDLAGHLDDPVFRVVGDSYAAYTGASLRDVRVSKVPANTLAERSVSYYREVIEKEVPISRGGEFSKSDGTTVLYRGVILPMSDDGETITGLLGAANCRELAEFG
jgi:hypothetical protein